MILWFGYIADPFLGGTFRDYIWRGHCLVAGHPGCK